MTQTQFSQLKGKVYFFHQNPFRTSCLVQVVRISTRMHQTGTGKHKTHVGSNYNSVFKNKWLDAGHGLSLMRGRGQAFTINKQDYRLSQPSASENLTKQSNINHRICLIGVKWMFHMRAHSV